MMPLCIFLVLLCEIFLVAAADKTSGVTQDSGIITVEVGQTVTLNCTCRENAVTFLSWYQQSLGGKPLLISTRMKHNPDATISAAYEERFQVVTEGGEGINHLRISPVQLSDSATYYCGILEFNAIEFGKGAFLHVKTSLSNIQAVYQPALEPLRPGESANLSCTIYAEKCPGEQSLYWYRHGAAQPVVMHHDVGQCMNKSHMKNCTLKLALKSVSSFDTGIYYCALASCGEIVFGNGTTVEILGGSTKFSPVVVYCLSVALAVSIILLLVLAFVMHKLKKNICSVCKGTVSHLISACDAPNQDADALHYAALSLKRASGRHRQDDSVETVCVYSQVKNRKQ